MHVEKLHRTLIADLLISLLVHLYCMQSLHVYLENRVFFWCVDHLNITHIMKAAATNGRIARLALWLSCWWYNLVHLNGTHVLMQIADAISRLAIANSDDPSNAVIPFEDDNVQGVLIDNMDLAKTIERFHPGAHKISDDHTGTLYRDGTTLAQPSGSTIGSPSKIGGKVIDLISCKCTAPIQKTNNGGPGTGRGGSLDLLGGIT